LGATKAAFYQQEEAAAKAKPSAMAMENDRPTAKEKLGEEALVGDDAW